MSKSQYPSAEGWIRGTYTLNSAEQLSEDDIKKIATWGKPDNYEFGPISQRGKTLKAIYREHNWQERCRKAA